MAATKVGFQLASSLASKHLTDAEFIKGGFLVVDTTAARDALPIATETTDGVIVKGSLCYCTGDSKFYQFNGTDWVEKEFGTTTEATASTAGLMSAADKEKLDGIDTGANKYEHPSTHAASMITGLAAVATSGSYNDLTNKPTIPTVNNATLAIQKNGTTVATFTANSSTNQTANITVPTKTSDLTNDSGFITGFTEEDPTVPDWAKAANKPSYTADEVGAVPDTRKVNGKTLSTDITLTADDINALADTTVLADLDQDENHRTVTDSEKQTWNAKSNFSGSYNDLTNIPDTFAPSSHEHDYIPTSQKGAANGVAELDSNGKVPSAQLPSYVDDIIEGLYENETSFKVDSAAVTGETGKIYVDTTTNKTYRWSGSTYVEISASLALGETSSTAYAGDKGKAAYDHSLMTTTNPHKVTKADVLLGDVVNTGDSAIPVEGGTTKFTTGGAYTELNKKVDKTITINGHELSSNIQLDKADIGLDKVENKSSTEIRNELTKDNVTTALGYTPLDAGKAAEHEHPYLPAETKYAGAESAGGAASSAIKLESSAGSETQPIYFADGKPMATTYTLGASVPSDAKFTDTTYLDATKDASGLMSAADKEKLDSLENFSKDYSELQNIPTEFTPSAHSHDDNYYTETEIDTKLGELDDKTVYSNSDPIVTAIGGISAGTTFENVPIKDLLTNLLYPYTKPVINSFTLTPGAGVKKKGDAITLTGASAKVTKKSKAISSVDLYKGTTLLESLSGSSITAAGTTLAFTEINDELDGSTNTTYTVKVSEENGTADVVTSTATYTFVDPYYCGVIDQNAEITDTLIIELTEKVEAKGTKNYTYTTTTEQCAVIAYPASYGEIKEIKDPNNFTQTWTKQSLTINSVDYYVYVSAAAAATDCTYKFSY